MMDFFKTIYEWLYGFFGVEQFIKILNSGNYSAFLTYDGIVSVIAPLFPIVLVMEILTALLYKKFKALDYKIGYRAIYFYWCDCLLYWSVSKTCSFPGNIYLVLVYLRLHRLGIWPFHLPLPGP
jgi:hypothetical protein